MGELRSISGSLDNRSVPFVLGIRVNFLRIYTDISIGHRLLRSVIHIQLAKARQQNIAISQKEHIKRICARRSIGTFTNLRLRSERLGEIGTMEVTHRFFEEVFENVMQPSSIRRVHA